MTAVQAPAPVVPAVTVERLPAAPRRLRPWSSAAATEQIWLEEGFAPPVPDLEDFLAEAPPPALRNTHRIVLALFLSLVGLSSVLKVDVVVSGSGRLAADAPTIVLQPMQLSVVRQIRVKSGDSVHRGDVLATLDPTFTQADKAALTAQHVAIRAQQARLDAEMAGTGFDEAGGAPEMLLQQSLFRQRRAQFDARLAFFGKKLRGIGIEVAANEQSQASLSGQLALAREVETMRTVLYRSQSGSKLNVLEAQSNRMRTERELQALAVHSNALEQERLAVETERQAFTDQWRRELTEELVKVRAEAQAVTESLTKANRLAELVALSAPEDGVVLEVAKRSVGSVLNAAEPLVTMISASAPLIAEIAIRSADVGSVKAGDEVVVKVDAFPFQRHGMLTGRLRSIVADSAAGPGGLAYHRGQVELNDLHLTGVPDGVRLMPGMTLSGEVKAGSRTVISYLLYPITQGFRESFREP